MIGEKVRNDLITSFKTHSTGNLAAFRSISVLFGVEEWEEMNLPSDSATLLDHIFLVMELDTAVVSFTVDLELFLGLKGGAALGTRHLERGLELDILIPVHFHLLSMVNAVLLLSYLVLRCLSVLLEELLAHEALDARAALVPAFCIHLVI